MKKNHQKTLFGHCQILPIAVVIILAGLLSACATGLVVRSDIDPMVDFSQYKTYNFFEPMGIEEGYTSPIFGEHYRASIGNELADETTNDSNGFIQTKYSNSQVCKTT